MLDSQNIPIAAERPGLPAGLPPKVALARRLLKAYAMQMYLGGATQKQVAKAACLDEGTILRWRREEGLVTAATPKGQCRLSTDVTAIKKAWDRGDLLREIAARHRSSSGNISAFAKRMGWPPRRPGRKKGIAYPGSGYDPEPLPTLLGVRARRARERLKAFALSLYQHGETSAEVCAAAA